jgi:serine/threonine protein kinase
VTPTPPEQPAGGATAAHHPPPGAATLGEAPTVPAPGAGPPDGDSLTVPGYEILARLDAGGQGVIYKARQLGLNRTVALKTMRYREPADSPNLARFRIEAEAVARLDHPHVVRIHDFGEHDGRPYFSMELVEGGSLAARLAAGPLAPHDAARLAETLARAMHYAHQRHIIHRDLKPANVLLTADGAVKVADFGLARRLDEEGRITVTHTVMGTASYMAPEQAEGRTREVGPAADVYALGAILYEMLTGRPPFRAETRELTILLVICDEPVRPTRLRADLPPELEEVCLKCLEKDPGQRYATALDLAEDLKRFQAGEPLAIRPLGEWERQTRWAARAGYEILELAGCSVLGLVYKARQLSLNRLVTLKTISARAQTEPDRLARFRAEAEAVAHLQHPNIVQIYDLGEQDGQPYIALEFVDGGSLADRPTGGPLSPRQAAQLTETLARATHHAHQRGIVHTDLRPFNVLLTADGLPKITGFGLARLLEKGGQESGARSVRRVFSNYIAPEQAAGASRHAIGPAADVHALGAMLYEMLTGQPPFLADSVADTLERIRTREAVPPSQFQPDLPQRLEAVCLKCLHKDPARRYPGAEELAEDLRRYLAQTEDFELVPGYELLEELGRGGTGVVYKARQLSLQRPVALKIFRERLDRVLAANRAVARLSHPNLVQVIDCGERDGLLYVAEELVDGTSLDRKIAGMPQPPGEAARLVETLAGAVHYAHQHGIVHRNLKPGVVLVTCLGVPKVGSFDLARLLDREDGDGEAEGEIRGTFPYLAPEQAAGRVRDVGPATDVYGLGAILYEMLTGRPPFQPGTALELMPQVLGQGPVPPRQLRPEVPAALEGICLKCLHKDPARRYPSAEALGDDLHGFLTVGQYPPGGPGVWRRVVDWVKRHPRGG